MHAGLDEPVRRRLVAAAPAKAKPSSSVIGCAPMHIHRWLLVAGAVGLGLASPLAQQSDTTRNPLAGRADAAAAGHRLYDQTCQSCHGAAGRGDRGPALDSGAFTHGNDDGDLFHTIRAGVPGSQMPPFPALTDEQTWQLVTYLRSLSPSAVSPNPPVVSNGSSAAGQSLFFGKAGCAGCHQVNGRGGIVGPDLSAAGRGSPAALRAKILDPSRTTASGRGAVPPQVITATLEDGRQIRGVRRNEDTFSAQIVDASGALHLVDKLTAKAYRVENTSLMPGDYATRLSAADVNDVVAYLSTLRERASTIDPSSVAAGGVTADRLAKAAAEPHNWLMYWGDYRATHYSALSQITAANVNQLRTAWTFPMPGESVLEATPLVADGVMYMTQPGAVVALDARTGRQIWRSNRPQKARSPYEINPFNRGVAIGGQRLFVGTLDAALVALDARTGLPLWETQVADTMLGYSLTSAPLVVKDKVLVGITGGEFGARGFLDAYYAATGRRLWPSMSEMTSWDLQ